MAVSLVSHCQTAASRLGLEDVAEHWLLVPEHAAENAAEEFLLQLAHAAEHLLLGPEPAAEQSMVEPEHAAEHLVMGPEPAAEHVLACWLVVGRAAAAVWLEPAREAGKLLAASEA